SPDGLSPVPATTRLVHGQVEALLASSAAFHELPDETREAMTKDLVKIASYSAECLRDMCWQSERLRPTALARQPQTAAVPAAANQPVATAQTSNFKPSAANQIGRVTKETLKAIAFPAFVADLIRSTFQAITQTNLQQMEAFSKLLSNATKTVDQFMSDNVSD